MTLALTAAQAQEARTLIARLGVLLGQAEAAPAPPVSQNPASSDAEKRDILAAADFAAAAAALRCAAADIRAVYAVESSGRAFGHDGRPTLLFEPHVFSRLTGHRFDATHGGVSYLKWGAKPYPRGTRDQQHTANWDKLIYAAKLDRDAAWQSASFGAPQIMGFNFADAGFADVHAFAAAMARSAADQLHAFVAIIRAWKLDDELREHRWAELTRRYNGPGQVAAYSAKLAAAHQVEIGRA